MKASTKKVIQTGLVAVVGAMTDISVQLMTLGSADVPRAVVVGMIVGAVARIAGAVLATITTTEASPPRESP